MAGGERPARKRMDFNDQLLTAATLLGRHTVVLDKFNVAEWLGAARRLFLNPVSAP
jgi:hypothetical protein